MRRQAPRPAQILGPSLFGLLLLAAGPSAAVDRHVPAQYATIQEAVDAAADAGDVIYVDAGPYLEDLDIGGKAITFIGVGGDVEILSFLASGGLGQIAVGTSLFKFSVAGPLIVSAGDTDFTLNDSDVLGETTLMFDAQADVTVMNSSFGGDVNAGGPGLGQISASSSTFSGTVTLDALDNILATGNDFNGDAEITAADFLLFAGNTMQGGGATLFANEVNASGNTITGPDRFGIQATRSASGWPGLIANNRISGWGQDPVPGTSPAAIEIVGPGGPIVAEYNVIFDGPGGMLVEDGTAGDEFRNNTILRPADFGFRAESLPPPGSAFSFRNNLVVTDAETATAMDLFLNIDPTDEDQWTFNSVSGPGPHWGGTPDLTGMYGNISGDPDLCDTGSFRPTSGSPLLPGNHPACEDGGLIGALDYDEVCDGDFTMDGTAEDLYGGALCIQTVETQFGNSNLGLTDHANGSELDGLFAAVRGRVLYVTITGNLESNGNKLEIFFDTEPGGQNKLRGDNPNVDADGLNRMGDDGSGNGLTFDTGFEADHYVTFTGMDPGSGYELQASGAFHFSLAGATWGELGSTGAGSDGILTGGSNPFGIRATIDNSNTAGVPAGTGPASGAGVTTGIEMCIPLCAFGIQEETAFARATGEIKICAFVNGLFHDFVSNQVLGSLQAPQANLGDPRNVDLSALPGQQFASIPLSPGAVGAPLVGRNPSASPVLLGAAPNPFRSATAIRFTLPAPDRVRVDVFNVQGRRVSTVLDGVLPAGVHAVPYEPQGLASGIYFYRVETGGFSAVRKITRLR